MSSRALHTHTHTHTHTYVPARMHDDARRPQEWHAHETRVDDELVQSIFRPAQSPCARGGLRAFRAGRRKIMLAILHDRVGCEVVLLCRSSAKHDFFFFIDVGYMMFH